MRTCMRRDVLPYDLSHFETNVLTPARSADSRLLPLTRQRTSHPWPAAYTSRCAQVTTCTVTNVHVLL